jgi:hypothetical protein
LSRVIFPDRIFWISERTSLIRVAKLPSGPS